MLFGSSHVIHIVFSPIEMRNVILERMNISTQCGAYIANIRKDVLVRDSERLERNGSVEAMRKIGRKRNAHQYNISIHQGKLHSISIARRKHHVRVPVLFATT